MAIYTGHKPDGTEFKYEWEAVSKTTAHITNREGDYCRFCLETNKGKGIGLWVGGYCSAGCKDSLEWVKANGHLFKKKEEAKPTEVSKVEEKKVSVNYIADPRAEQFFDKETRVFVMFSELCKAGAAGMMISDITKVLVELFNADEKSVKQDIATKCSKWCSLSANKHPDEWWLLQSEKPAKGRPASGETKDRRLWLVWSTDDELPSEAFIPEDTSKMPSWLSAKIKKKEVEEKIEE